MSGGWEGDENSSMHFCLSERKIQKILVSKFLEHFICICYYFRRFCQLQLNMQQCLVLPYSSCHASWLQSDIASPQDLIQCRKLIALVQSGREGQGECSTAPYSMKFFPKFAPKFHRQSLRLLIARFSLDFAFPWD